MFESLEAHGQQVVEFVKRQCAPEFEIEIKERIESTRPDAVDTGEPDELVDTLRGDCAVGTREGRVLACLARRRRRPCDYGCECGH